MNSIFYVYEHWRPDKDVCFYVGKGKKKRAYSFVRGPRYNRVVKKLSRLGMCVEVRLVHGALTEAEAFQVERERIAFWRSVSIELCNHTDGGDGTSGYKHSDATRAQIAAKALGRKVSDQTRLKMRIKRRGVTHSAETKAKIAASAKLSQKIRADKERSSKAGEKALRLRMIKLARSGRGTPEYSEKKRRGALAANKAIRAKKPVIPGLS
jgi:hypothetical protein